MKIFFRSVIFILLGLFIVVIISIVIHQITIEKYITKQKLEYSILEDRARTSFTPFLYYHFKRKVLGIKNNNYKLTSYLYRNYVGESIMRNNYYDEYIIECYFSNAEIRAALQKVK